MGYESRVPAAERTMKILELLAATPEGMTAGELEAALEIPRSALFALLNTLKELGYVAQEASRRPYLPGPRLQALQTPRATGTNALLMAFYEESALHPPEETLGLATLSDGGVVVLAEAPCDAPVRGVLTPGRRYPAPEHPAGLVLLAGRPTPDAGLAARLRHVREENAAREVRDELVTLAVPICPDGIRPEAALIASVPPFRWDEGRSARLLNTLREIAARLSHRLGALTYHPYGAARPHHLGPSVAMAPEERRTFLEGPWAARLACVRPDGSPHVVPIWYEWHDESFLVAAWPGSLWADFVARNPAVALTIDEPWPPMRRVLVRGNAHPLAPEAIPGGLDGFYQRLSVRYLGASGNGTPARRSADGWRAFRIPPETMAAYREEVRGAD